MGNEKIYLLPSLLITFCLLMIAGIVGYIIGSDTGVVREGLVPMFGASIMLALVFSLYCYFLGLIAAVYKKLFKLPYEILYINTVLIYMSIVLPLFLIAKEFYTPTVDGGFVIFMVPLFFFSMIGLLLVSSAFAKLFMK